MSSPVKGWKAKVFVAIPTGAAWKEIRVADHVSLAIDSNIDAFIAVGKIFPILAEGPRVLTGSMTEAWVDNDLLEPLYSGTTFDFYVVRDSGSTSYAYYVMGKYCVVEGLSTGLPSDDFIVQDLSFKARNWTYGVFVSGEGFFDSRYFDSNYFETD